MTKTVVDPVCGMTITPEHAAGAQTYRGVTYHFCNPGCLKKFETDPERYLNQEQPSQNSEQAEYTCPMHPEIRQKAPGNCPKCGMALEPVMPAAEEGENPELADFRRRFW